MKWIRLREVSPSSNHQEFLYKIYWSKWSLRLPPPSLINLCIKYLGFRLLNEKHIFFSFPLYSLSLFFIFPKWMRSLLFQVPPGVLVLTNVWGDFWMLLNQITCAHSSGYFFHIQICQYIQNRSRVGLFQLFPLYKSGQATTMSCCKSRNGF